MGDGAARRCCAARSAQPCRAMTHQNKTENKPYSNNILAFQILHTGGVLDEKQRQELVQDWLSCKSQLLDQSRQMRHLKEAHEMQLVTLSRQLLELECGLRKRERELCSLLQQRESRIREQAHIIQFLRSQKSSQKSKTDILSLASQAASKIPQFNEDEKEKESDHVTQNETKKETLTSILESESENDSAVIIDDNLMTASPKSVSRSVSDVMSSEAEVGSDKSSSHSPFASPNYRGFLLRHGSYERYKIRSMRLQHVPSSPKAAEAEAKAEMYSNPVVVANATLPRNRKKIQKKPKEAEKCTTVIVINR